MRFVVLGPVRVERGAVAEEVGGARERFVLACLLAHADRPVPADSLVDQLWATPPDTARAQLHNLISRLRRRLDPGQTGLIVTRPGGYELRLAGHGLDLLDFRSAVRATAEAIDDGDAELAHERINAALDLWRGPAFADVPADQLPSERASLREEWYAAREQALATAFARQRYADVIELADDLLDDEPYHERAYEWSMRAHAAAGEPEEAVNVYDRAHRLLTDELGVEPAAALQHLRRSLIRGEAVDTPAATTLTPRQLPPPGAVLTGQDKLLDELTDLLRSGNQGNHGNNAAPIAVLVGPGGIGKTTLALSVAHQVAAEFPDGQLYAELRGSGPDPVNPHEVAGRFLRALGADTVPEGSDDRLAAYRSRLEGTRTLIVLDDAGDQHQVSPLLPPEGSGVLITSRYQLGDIPGAEHHRVPLLSSTSAIDLLRRIVGPERVLAEPAAAEAIVAACGRLPLAVSVAAARLAVDPHWTLAGLRERLGAQRGRLDELTVGDLDVRATIGLSYEQLRPAARRLFRLLGLVSATSWPGWVPAELAAGSLLDDLLNAHLVEPLGRDLAGQPRYRMHDLVADLARERAEQEDPPDVRRAAIEALLGRWLGAAALADEHIPHGRATGPGSDLPEPPAGLAESLLRDRPRDWFASERASLVAAVVQAAELGRADLAGPLALAQIGFAAIRNQLDDQDRVLSAAVTAARTARDDGLLGRLLTALSGLRAQQSDYTDLHDIAAEQQTIARRLNDPELELRAIKDGAFAAACEGKLVEAGQLLDEGLTLAGSQGLPGITALQVLRADLHVDVGEADRAVRLFDAAMPSLRAKGCTRRLAIDLGMYAWALAHAGEYAAATAAVAEAREIATELGDDLGLAHLALNDAEIALLAGDREVAEQWLPQARRQLDAFDDLVGQAAVRLAHGDLHVLRDELDEALALLEESLAIRLQMRTPLQIGRLYARIERIQLASGRPAEAENCRREWQTTFAELGLDERALQLPAYYPSG